MKRRKTEDDPAAAGPRDRGAEDGRLDSADGDLQLLAVRGLIAGLPAKQQAAVRDAAALLRGVIAKAGEAGLIALALVGCEQQGGQ